MRLQWREVTGARCGVQSRPTEALVVGKLGQGVTEVPRLQWKGAIVVAFLQARRCDQLSE